MITITEAGKKQLSKYLTPKDKPVFRISLGFG